MLLYKDVFVSSIQFGSGWEVEIADKIFLPSLNYGFNEG